MPAPESLDTTPSLRVIDFHNHHVPARFELTAVRAAPPSQRARWEALARKLPDEALMLKDVHDGRLAARVINIPAALIADADGHVHPDTIRAVNDEVAALVARHPGALHGLASIDAFDGERAARETERAVGDLGLRGLLVDCASGDLLLDAPQARPTLAAAARLGVPVFAHPVAPQPLTRQMAPYGVVGTLFARGTVNSACLIALVESGAFAELPALRVVVTGHAIGGLAMASGLANQTAVDLIGADHVLAGSDWPIVDDGPIAGPLADAMRSAGLGAAEQQAIAAGNCLRLLGLG
jgi:aminocarboxymuconate-semialdehyde decarboxylase